jgi:hypothetical protein
MIKDMYLINNHPQQSKTWRALWSILTLSIEKIISEVKIFGKSRSTTEQRKWTVIQNNGGIS